MKKNIVLGGSGLIGCSFKELIKNNKGYVFYSKKKFKDLETFNLDSSIKKFPYKEVNTCFFFSSPRIIKKNFKKEIFEKEFLWLKKVVDNLKINKFIYLSSSSIYYKKNHHVGIVKKKCENYLLKNDYKFDNLQIWRPFNLVAKKYVKTDHFYNFLFKKMFIDKIKKYTFFGSPKDKRGYSNVNDFTKILYKYSKKNVNFLKDYGNTDLITIDETIKLFNKYYFKINKNFFIAKFKSNIADINKVNNKKDSIFSKKKSINVLESYIKESLK